ncbi:MAG: S-methyl-5-thioribose-1-phosphate isomerase [Pirellulales bacterium]|nr:S-methyl-5-thioribose-1-phosphate isomerase [Pirellulales bacterium]
MPTEQHETLKWIGGVDGCLRMIDQTRLPVEFAEIDCRDAAAVWEAIKMLRVRGAPAIGIAAAYGVCVGLQTVLDADEPAFFRRLRETVEYLASSRPTAVNLFWALKRMETKADSLRGRPVRKIAESLLTEARAIHEEDRQMCRAIGRHGAELLRDGQGVLTHCNAGGLATADYGTALAVFYSAAESGKTLHVFADETRPLLQGARLTAWELQQRGIDVTLICDSTAAQVMREGKVQAVVTGADRIAANGDAANKIGTYCLAVLARAHDLPFYIAAPSSTFDLSISSGAEIPIEQRDPREITHGFGRQTAPDGIQVYNPAFDVTPAELIAAIICEKGVIRPVNEKTIARCFLKAREQEGKSGATNETTASDSDKAV